MLWIVTAAKVGLAHIRDTSSTRDTLRQTLEDYRAIDDVDLPDELSDEFIDSVLLAGDTVIEELELRAMARRKSDDNPFTRPS